VKELLKSGSIIVVLGPGGVGKTTIAAAIGLAAARAGFPTAVLTVDPARRLRDALGLERLEAQPHRLDGRRLRAAGLDPRLAFSASALDVKATWDGLVERFVPTGAARQQILENNFYRNLTQRFAGAESYAALEQLRVMHDDGAFAIEVVDTPPAIHAFDFIEAPDHLARLLDSGAARWLMNWSSAAAQHRTPLSNRIGRVIVAQLEEFAGSRPLSAIAEFFGVAAEAIEVIRQRMLDASVLLRSLAVRFVVVTTAAEDRICEAQAIVRRLKTEKLRLAAVVINRAADQKTFAALADAPSRLPPHLLEIAQLRTINATDRLRAIADFLGEYAAAQGASIIRAAGFARELPARIEVVAVPELDDAIADLRGLAKIADWVIGATADRRFLEQAAKAFTTRSSRT
jgi:anion-transporting  ArsA/GET3 family ATPase